MMKRIKTVFSSWLLAVAVTACAQEGTMVVRINVADTGDTLLISEGGRRDTVMAQNGAFKYEKELQTAGRIVVATPGTFRGTEQKFFQRPAVPGETLEVTGTWDDLKFGGSTFYQDYEAISAEVAEASKELDDYNAELAKRIEAGESRDSVVNEYERESPPYYDRMRARLMEVVRKNNDREAMACFIIHFMDLDKMEEAVSLLSDRVRNGRMKDICYEGINRMKAQQEAEEKAAKAQSAGVEVADFTLEDINGQPLTFSSLRGQYVLLDFWGSWCYWCIKGMPQMKEYYAKYKGKFEILGIDCGDTSEKWKEAVAKHELPWKHVINGKGEADVTKQFAIQGYPTKILVGPDGKIVKTVVGEDPTFYSFLDETFGK